MKLRWMIAPLLIVTSQARAQNLDCFAPQADPHATVAACTQAIADPKLAAGTLPLALSARANAYVALNDTAKALADFDTALALVPNDINDLMSRARLREATDPLLAERDYTSVIAIDPAAKTPATAVAMTRRGTLRIARGDVAGGIDDLGEARRLDPHNPDPLKIRGAYFLRTGDLFQAIAEFTAALALKSDDADTLIQRATAYARQNNFTVAIADFTTALKIAPTHLTALEGRGVAHLQNGNADAAITDFSALLAQKPGDISASFLRATARLQAANWTGADEDYTSVLAVRGSDTESLLGRALAREFTGNFDGAETDLSTILKSKPDAARALATRGHVRFMAAKFAEAAVDYAKAMALPNAPADLALWHFIATRRLGAKDADFGPASEKTPDQWPAPIMRYFLGTLSGDAVLAIALHSPDPGARLCEVYFYLGQAALLQDETKEAARLFAAAIATGKAKFTEYAAAKAELAHLKSH